MARAAGVKARHGLADHKQATLVQWALGRRQDVEHRWAAGVWPLVAVHMRGCADVVRWLT